MGLMPIFCFCNLRAYIVLSCRMGVRKMQDLHTLIEASVTQLGYALVDLEISNRGKVLRVFIDKQNPVDVKDSVNIDDCVLVSNQLGNLLAVENEIEYDRLEVSSPGMDRVLRKEADFLRFIGERATVKLHVPMIEEVKSTKANAKEEKVTKKNFLGFLRGLENGVLLLECDGVTYNIALTNIDKSRLSPAF